MPDKSFNEDEKRSQANAIINGWYFQIVAALAVFINDMANYSEIGFEKQDDFVLKRRNDGLLVYGQAKSSLGYEEIWEKGHLATMKESLRTLANHADEAAFEYISIFNFRVPFGKLFRKSDPIHGDQHQIFKEADLPSALKSDLEGYLSSKNKSLNFRKLAFWFFPFEGQEGCRAIKTYLSERLSWLGTSVSPIVEDILRRWHALLLDNGRDKSGYISTDLLSGTLFSAVVKCNLNIEAVATCAGYEFNPIELDGIQRQLLTFFDKTSRSLSLFFKIIAPYDQYRSDNAEKLKESSGDLMSQYVKTIVAVPDEFKEWFDPGYGVDPLTAYKLLSAYVISKNALLLSVKRGFGYAN